MRFFSITPGAAVLHQPENGRQVAEARALKLDLREAIDLERSRLLHRLSLLDIEWGKFQDASGREKGTFGEYWKLQWQPELSIDLVEAGMWVTTIQDAAASYASGAADSAPDLPSLTVLLGDVILADLPEAALHLIYCLQEQAALASDTGHLMDALSPLARRTFSTFDANERQALGERVRRQRLQKSATAPGEVSVAVDQERGAATLPVLARLLGFTQNSETPRETMLK